MDVLNLGDNSKSAISVLLVGRTDKLVAEIESKLSAVDQIEKETEAELEKTEALRQSILKKAFAGQLVPQDPHDEPASVLLDRIRTEREKAMQNNHSKKTKKRKTAA